jgi:hypothetical protein
MTVPRGSSSAAKTLPRAVKFNSGIIVLGGYGFNEVMKVGGGLLYLTRQTKQRN